MQIAIRLDDITPDMDWERFLAFKEILDKCGIKPLIGVVPDNRDENLHRAEAADGFWAYIKELQENGWCVALHGCRHIYTTKKGGLFPLNRFSEFAGVPFDRQKEMLSEAAEILEKNGIRTDIFMAPAHSYDRNTLYPISFLLSRSLKKKSGVTTMVVHTHDIDDAGMERMRRLLAEQQDHLISYSDFLAMASRKKGVCGHLWEHILATAKRVLVKLKQERHG